MEAVASDGALGRAAAYCRNLTKKSRSNFYYAFLFLPTERREALYSVYAFCRLVDDIVDGADPPERKAQALQAWRERLDDIFHGGAEPADAVGHGLWLGKRRFGLRHEDALAIVEGCEMDLGRTRYQTWDELRTYCYRVASAVGLLCIQIFGARSPLARAYAVDLGLALQLTNILRDVGEDAARGRIYLPLSDLAAFGVTEEDLLRGRRTPEVVALLQHQAQRARGLYGSARAALPAEDRRSLMPAEIMGETYFALLQTIERRGFDVLGQAPGGPVALSRRQKLAIALGTFCKLGVGS